MEKILISACLVGENTRYDGKSNYLPIVEKLKEKYDLIPFCPEVAGGLSIPRDPCEIKGLDIVTKDGVSKAKEYNLGAKKALEACKLFGIRIAILMESSPSCGVRNIHDGHFNKTKIPGKGVTTRLLETNGIHCYSSLDDLSFLIQEESKEGKEYLSYDERTSYLRNRSRMKKGPRRPFKDRVPSENAVNAEEKPNNSENSVSENEVAIKKERTYNSKPSFRHSDKKRTGYGHKNGEGRSFRKDGFKKGEGKSSFRKNDGERKFRSDNKFSKDRKSYGNKNFHGEKKSYGEKKTYGDKKSSFSRRSTSGKPSYNKGTKRFGKQGNYHKTNKKSA